MNMIYIGALVLRSLAIQPRKIYFLVGYTEELLSCLLSCPVKLEIQTVQIKQDVGGAPTLAPASQLY
jgi:small subunit ribosomal protein S24